MKQRYKILTDNIFGVDIDPLTVAITKYCLSMKCSEGKDFSLDLDKNIRCGNSLIETDFCWRDNFSHVFEQGGFDVVIGKLYALTDEEIAIVEGNAWTQSSNPRGAG